MKPPPDTRASCSLGSALGGTEGVALHWLDRARRLFRQKCLSYLVISPEKPHPRPLYQEVAKRFRHRVGARWSVDETHVKVAGRWGYVYQSSNEYGQVMELLFREQRDTEATTAFFRSALENTRITPQKVNTDKAAVYPAALAPVLPKVEHITGKAEQQRIERDYQHWKGKLKVFRGCKTPGGAQRFCQAHSFLRNLCQGFYQLGTVPRNTKDTIWPQLVRAWEELTIQLLVT